MLNNSEFIIEIRGSGGEQERDRWDRPSVTAFSRDALVCPTVTFRQARRMFGFGSGGFESWKTISL